MSLYLGFDASTQSLSATVIDANTRRILLTRSFRFDDELPGYGTRAGVLPQSDPTIVHAPPLMWTEALDRMIGKLTADIAVDWGALRAISGSAQQHGSVYLNAIARQRLGALDPGSGLADQLGDVFSRGSSPVWMDSSTTVQCAAIEAALGGAAALARLTGSRAFERFTGPQIRKFAEQDPDGYRATDRIHLVSSWMTSLLAGAHAPIDVADGSGMNLMDLGTGRWSPEAARATAPDLLPRLPPLVSSHTVAGRLAPFWQRRHRLPDAKVVAWSGDNPCSLVGTGVVREGIVAVSLGTSDTIFGIMREPRVSGDGTGHVFASPTGEFMGMTVFKNGSLARERIREAYGLDWTGVSLALNTTPAGNRQRTILPWFEPEITPLVLDPGIRRHGLDPGDAAANVRALIEAQMLALRLHSRWMDVEIGAVYATGGASANREILQVLADVFGAPVYQMQAANSAALGAALRACHADRVESGAPVSWPDILEGFVEPAPGSAIAPIAGHVAAYAQLLPLYAARERDALRTDKNEITRP